MKITNSIPNENKEDIAFWNEVKKNKSNKVSMIVMLIAMAKKSHQGRKILEKIKP